MPKYASWKMDQTHDSLEMFSNNFSCTRGTTLPNSMYVSIVDFLNGKYSPGSYDLDSQISKYQRMKGYYKANTTLLKNTSLSWDEETKTVTCWDKYLSNFKVVS